MHKKLLALAIAGISGTAFAQTSVTITGLIDVGYLHTNTQTTTAGKDSQDIITGSNSQTSTIIFKGTEDLGNGLTAGFVLESLFAAGVNQTTGVTAGTVPSITNAPFSNQMFNAENYVMLSSRKVGTIKLGNVNNAGLYIPIKMQPFGTQIGSGYSGGFSRLNGVGTNGLLINNNATSTPVAGFGGSRLIRVANSAKYESPLFNGFQVTGQLAFKNDNDQYSSFGYRELAATYKNGPLDVGYTNARLDSGANTVSMASNAAAISNTVTNHNLLGGNYDFGPVVLYGGWTSSKQNNAVATTVDASSWNIGLKWKATSLLNVLANYVNVNDKLAANVDRRLIGLGLDYNLSKRSALYARYESGDGNRSNPTTGEFNRVAAGIVHRF